ncbi:MAG: histidine phosphatase family protein [Bacteroidetes bacterium]|nr:histidine phosphatase family protein [Bacteroidota bacterium]
MILILIRHAKTEAAWPDRTRRLLPEGEERCLANALWLQHKGWVPEKIVYSPATRTWQTAELMNQHLGAELIEREDLYESRESVYQKVIQDFKAECLAVLGHNPEIGFLAELWSAGSISSFKPGAMAVFGYESTKSPVGTTGPQDFQLLGYLP